MKEFLEFWPVFVFTFALFMSSISIAVALTLWISGKLSEQDAKRIEMKEAILLELRGTIKELHTSLSIQHGALNKKMEEINIRLTRMETVVGSTEYKRNNG